MLFRSLDAAIADTGTGDASPADALDRIGELARRRRALVVLASDLFDPDDRTLPALRRLRALRHDVVVLHVLAPEERTLPYEGLTLFEALEGDHKLLANPSAIRADYVAKMDAFLARVTDELTQVSERLHEVERESQRAVEAIATLRQTRLDLGNQAPPTGLQVTNTSDAPPTIVTLDQVPDLVVVEITVQVVAEAE